MSLLEFLNKALSKNEFSYLNHSVCLFRLFACFLLLLLFVYVFFRDEYNESHSFFTKIGKFSGLPCPFHDRTIIDF